MPRRIRTAIHAELIRAARLKDWFFTPRFTGLMIRALEESAAIRHVMADLIAGRQTYHGLRRRLLMTLEVRLMWQVLESLILIPESLGSLNRSRIQDDLAISD